MLVASDDVGSDSACEENIAADKWRKDLKPELKECMLNCYDGSFFWDIVL